MTAAAGVTPADPAAIQKFVDKFADLLVAGGIGRMPARVFAALIASEGGSKTAAELAHLLRVSPAAVSGAVRYLIGVRMIARRRPMSTRRDEYWLHDNRYEMIMQRDTLLMAWATQMRESVETAGPSTPAGRDG